MVIIFLARDLKLGMRGDDVLALKRALSEAGYGKWLGYKFTKLFGPATLILLKRFQKAHGLNVDGVYGSSTHKKLAPYYDAWGAKLMNGAYHELKQTPSAKSIAAALAVYNYCRLTGRGLYTQTPSRMSIVRNRWRPPFWPHTLQEDCSSSCTAHDWLAGNPDPNNLGYNGQGYTGTLVVHGTRSSAVLGALAFYGYNFPMKHVTRCIGFKNGTPMVFTWGHGLPGITNYNYRSDFNHWRKYYE